MNRVTLVGQSWARVGARFLNQQPCEVAASCPVSKACQNLPWDREFEVVEVRSVQHRVCHVHEEGAHAVVVRDVPVRASLNASKTRGTAARWEPPVCRFRGCPNWDRCFPHGVEAGKSYVVRSVESKLVCPMGYDLVGVIFDEPST